MDRRRRIAEEMAKRAPLPIFMWIVIASSLFQPGETSQFSTGEASLFDGQDRVWSDLWPLDIQLIRSLTPFVHLYSFTHSPKLV